MSASNWSVCPRCITTTKAEHDKRVEAVYDAYGKVPLEEFEAMRDALPELDFEETLREDYEIYGAESGTVTIDYSASCTRCDLHYGFTEEKELPV